MNILKTLATIIGLLIVLVLLSGCEKTAAPTVELSVRNGTITEHYVCENVLYETYR